MHVNLTGNLDIAPVQLITIQISPMIELKINRNAHDY